MTMSHTVHWSVVAECQVSRSAFFSKRCQFLSCDRHGQHRDSYEVKSTEDVDHSL